MKRIRLFTLGMLLLSVPSVGAVDSIQIVLVPGDHLFAFEGKGVGEFEERIVKLNPQLGQVTRLMRVNQDQILLVLRDGEEFNVPDGATAVLNPLGPSSVFRQPEDEVTFHVPSGRERLDRYIAAKNTTFWITKRGDRLEVKGIGMLKPSGRNIARDAVIGKIPGY